jgi:chloramphenicol 3-O phosphotransferase
MKPTRKKPDRAQSPQIDPYPRCILLNGTSSSGKTTLARALQERLPVVFLNFSIDSVLYALPPSDLSAMIEGAPVNRAEYRYGRLVEGFHAAITGLLTTGNRLIVDNALTQPEWKVAFNAAVAGFDTLRVGVMCDPDEARQRERGRGDRAIGTVDSEMPLVHESMDYDLVIDTTKDPADLIVDAILKHINSSI